MKEESFTLFFDTCEESDTKCNDSDQMLFRVQIVFDTQWEETELNLYENEDRMKLQQTKPTIDVFVLDNNQKVIKSQRKTQTGFAQFETQSKGEFSILLSNQRDRSHMKNVSIGIRVEHLE